MDMDCKDRERIFLDGSSEEWAALEAHAATCAPCGRELEAWKRLSATAQELREQWDSPSLWPRIEQALRERTRPPRWSWFDRLSGGSHWSPLGWQTALAGLLLAVLTGAAVWFAAKPSGRAIPDNQALLNDHTVREVERAEAAYEQAIDKLDAQARPELQNASAPLLAGYREKLQVLDSAIAELKSQAGVNPANGHLRRQLLAMYREKQETLEQVLEAKQ